MKDLEIRAALERHWTASATGNQDAEHEIYHDDAIVEYPQSGEASAGDTTCKPFAASTRPNRQALLSGGLSAGVTSGSPSM